MTKTYPLTAAQDPLTGDYEQVLYWTVHEKPARAALIQILAIPVFILLGFAFAFLAVHVGKLPDIEPAIGPLPLGAILASIAGTLILHELVHGLTMRMCGATPQYGLLWKQLMFYATCPGYGFRRNTYILMALAPFVGLSSLAVVGMILLQGTNWVALLALCATINGSGAFGDMWLVSLVLHYPNSAYVVDERDGVRVLMRSRSTAW